MFSEIEMLLHEQLGDLAISVEHVGSTSIPGIAAKPIIDIDIVIDSMELLPKVIEELSDLGYCHEGNLGIERREAFTRKDSKVPYNKEMNRKYDHHLYVCDKDSNELKRHITFRDILRKHAQLAEEYSNLKRDLQRYIGIIDKLIPKGRPNL